MDIIVVKPSIGAWKVLGTNLKSLVASKSQYIVVLSSSYAEN